MPKLKVERLQEGMVVALDVRNMDQMLLLPAGCTLAQKHIGILQAWGITDVEVASTDGFDDSGDPMTQLSSEESTQLTADTKAIFWHLDETSPVELEIFQLVLRRAARRLIASKTNP